MDNVLETFFCGTKFNHNTSSLFSTLPPFPFSFSFPICLLTTKHAQRRRPTASLVRTASARKVGATSSRRWLPVKLCGNSSPCSKESSATSFVRRPRARTHSYRSCRRRILISSPTTFTASTPCSTTR